MNKHRETYLVSYRKKDGKLGFKKFKFNVLKDRGIRALKSRKDVIDVHVVYKTHNDEAMVTESWDRRKLFGVYTNLWKRVDNVS